MSDASTTKRLLRIENEQRAQKVGVALNYGQLNKPSEAPSQTWSGFVPNGAGGEDVARWRATFTREDGIEIPPFVEFVWGFVLGKSTYQDYLNAGFVSSVSGRDLQATDEVLFSDGLYAIGQNYVSWNIEVKPNLWYWMSGGGNSVQLTVEAVSVVKGTLSLVRVI